MGFIGATEVRAAAARLERTEYGQYLCRMLDGDGA